ncbi:hypothetical protein OROGR_004772 [Orobanche gracilis]
MKLGTKLENLWQHPTTPYSLEQLITYGILWTSLR